MTALTVTHEATAWDLIGFDNPETCVRVKGGRALYEAVIFYDDTPGERVKLARLEAGSDGIRQINRYVAADTILEVVEVT